MASNKPLVPHDRTIAMAQPTNDQHPPQQTRRAPTTQLSRSSPARGGGSEADGGGGRLRVQQSSASLPPHPSHPWLLPLAGEDSLHSALAISRNNGRRTAIGERERRDAAADEDLERRPQLDQPRLDAVPADAVRHRAAADLRKRDRTRLRSRPRRADRRARPARCDGRRGEARAHPSDVVESAFDATTGAAHPKGANPAAGVMAFMLRLHIDLFTGLAGQLLLGAMGVLFVAAIVSARSSTARSPASCGSARSGASAAPRCAGSISTI